MPFEKLIFERISRITVIIEPTGNGEDQTLEIIAPIGSGKTDPPTGIIKYKTGDTVTIYAEPDPEWVFSEWKLNWLPDLKVTENPLVLHL